MDEFLADLMGKIDTIGSAYVQTAYMTISTPLNVSLKILISISIAWVTVIASWLASPIWP